MERRENGVEIDTATGAPGGRVKRAGFSPSTSRGTAALRNLDLGLLASRTGREYASMV